VLQKKKKRKKRKHVHGLEYLSVLKEFYYDRSYIFWGLYGSLKQSPYMVRVEKQSNVIQ
jgi:hypothetical protein